jgi:hypothetical protein
MHLDNIGVVVGPRSSKIVLIDFGQAQVNNPHPLLDFLSVLRGTLVDLKEIPSSMFLTDAQLESWWQNELNNQAQITQQGLTCLRDKEIRRIDDQCADKIAEMYKLRNLKWMKAVLSKWFTQRWPHVDLPPVTEPQFGTRIEELQDDLWQRYIA